MKVFTLCKPFLFLWGFNHRIPFGWGLSLLSVRSLVHATETPGWVISRLHFWVPCNQRPYCSGKRQCVLGWRHFTISSQFLEYLEFMSPWTSHIYIGHRLSSFFFFFHQLVHTTWTHCLLHTFSSLFTCLIIFHYCHICLPVFAITHIITWLRSKFFFFFFCRCSVFFMI